MAAKFSALGSWNAVVNAQRSAASASGIFFTENAYESATKLIFAAMSVKGNVIKVVLLAKTHAASTALTRNAN